MISPNNEIEAALILRRLPGIGDARHRQLVAAYGSARAALSARGPAWEGTIDVTVARAAALALPDGQWAQSQMDSARAAVVEIIALGASGYPERLQDTPVPPAILYVAGIPAWRLPCVAIVGSRRCGDHGRELARRMAREMAAAGVCVVSGLARGIDAAAHEGALEAGGATIAVLGCGVDRLQVAENRALQRQVRKKGALVAEQPLGQHAGVNAFPRRNRIISGLCEAVVVVDAPLRSGALITARNASDQGRLVFAVPGDPVSGRSSGCHALIKRGAARLADCASDVLDALSITPCSQTGATSATSAGARPALAGSEAVVHSILDEVRHVDDVIQRSGLAPTDALGVLLRMELTGTVTQLAGKRFCRRL